MCIEIFSDRKLSIINQLKVTTWYRKIPFVCAAQLIHPIKGCVSSLEPRLRRKLHTVYSTTKPVKETKRSCNDSTCLEELEREETLAGMQDIRETAATPGTAGIIAVQAATAHTLETSMDRVVVRAIMRFVTFRFASTNVLLVVVIL